MYRRAPGPESSGCSPSPAFVSQPNLRPPDYGGPCPPSSPNPTSDHLTTAGLARLCSFWLPSFGTNTVHHSTWLRRAGGGFHASLVMGESGRGTLPLLLYLRSRICDLRLGVAVDTRLCWIPARLRFPVHSPHHLASGGSLFCRHGKSTPSLLLSPIKGEREPGALTAFDNLEIASACLRQTSQ